VGNGSWESASRPQHLVASDSSNPVASLTDNRSSNAVAATVSVVAALALLLAAAPSSLAADGGAAAPAGSSAPRGSEGSFGSGGGGSAGNGGARSGSHNGGGRDPNDTGGSSSGGSGASNRKHNADATVEPSITGVRCVPEQSCGAKALEVSLQDGQLLLTGRGIGRGMGVAFASRRHGRRLGPGYLGAPRAHLRKTKLGLVVSIPKLARTGRIAVVIAGRRHTPPYGPILVTSKKLHPPPKPASTTIQPPPTGTAFDGQGMWIWYVSKSDGGNVSQIIEQARDDGISTLYVKSSDGTNWWSQFSPSLVDQVHAAGLQICAWQYVYGTAPVVEAELGAKAAELGADCLVIDAESEYEGRYSAAQAYIDKLREEVGSAYPVGLASFPYVNYHEAFPYSVFLGPEGAQFNAPQMYWKDIGSSVAQVFALTYEQNLVYGREIEPLGQSFENPSSAELVSFRSLASDYGASGLSLWDWQQTTASGWASLTKPLNSALTVPSPEITSPLLRRGDTGDQVLWLQEHLAAAIPSQPVTGIFEADTAANLQSFQAGKGLPRTGETDASTWGYLLELAPVAVDWTGGDPKA
jgi:Putative peptidoglycan binding domain